MQKVDRFLFGILAGVLALVLIAFAVVLTRPKTSYLPDDTPAAAVHNYLLALQQDDYGRAYVYLSQTLPGYPRTLEAFRQSVSQQSWQFSGLKTASFEVSNSALAGDSATVTVKVRDARAGGPFNAQGTPTRVSFNLQRNRATGTWQIVNADDYWPYCWQSSPGC